MHDEHPHDPELQAELDALHGGLSDDHDDTGMNWGIVVAVLLVAAAIGYIIFDGLESETYFYTVDEAVAQGPELAGQTVRVKGIVEPGSIVGEDGELVRTFRIAEKGKFLKVTYARAMPDTFKEEVEVVVHGEVDDSLTVVADEVMVKCPSRYEGNAPTAMEGVKPRASL